MELKRVHVTEEQRQLLNAMTFGATNEAANCLELLRKITSLDIAANFVVRAQFAAACSVAVSVGMATGQTITADDLIPILREVMAGKFTDEAEARAMVERDLSGAVQQ